MSKYGPELKMIMEEKPVSHMQQSPTLLERLWMEADDSYAQLTDNKQGTRAHDELKGRCRGLATALAIFNTPMTYDDVRRMVHRRWATGQTELDAKAKTKRELRRQP